ncbi:MAG: 2-amino-4-hydroxy-6-hydroxymethyldihydropteridine pyrophosphokinae [Pseudomonadota bacterium]|jgi:2-amino-4-hydroxy-6-hydroxymethyldihydropteridine diphosphokinase
MNDAVTAYIGLGGNLGDVAAVFRAVCAELDRMPDLQLVARSGLYRSRPMGPSDQPDYLNAVIAVTTRLAPLALLDALQRMELLHGRVRKEERWGARTLDLDLLLYADQIIHSERLSVPHYGLPQREFVLYPLAEIAPPGFSVPGIGLLASLLQDCPLNGLERIDDV